MSSLGFALTGPTSGHFHEGQLSATEIVDCFANSPPGELKTHLKLSNPKNYVGVPIAVRADGATAGLIPQHLTTMAGEVRRGATSLGLLNNDGELTPHGHAVVDVAEHIEGGPTRALETLGGLKRKRTRFVDALPQWKPVAQAVFGTLPQVQAILDVVQQAPSGGFTLPQLATVLSHEHPDVADSTLLSSSVSSAEIRKTTSPTDPTSLDVLSSSDAYQTLATFQLKSLLYHSGILTTPGVHSGTITPESDHWEVDTQNSSIAAGSSGGEW